MAEKKEIQYVGDNARPRGKSGIRKTHQEFCEELNQLNMHVDPQEEYVSAYTKIRFKCKVCGYEWLTAPTNITNKRHGCPLCARKRLSQQKLKTTEDFKTTLSTINPQIEIIGEYLNNSSKIECHCLICGHIWSALPTNLVKGRGCPNCSHTATSFVEQTIRLSFVRILGDECIISRDCNEIGMELDLYIPQLGIAIEPGNWFWHKDKIARDNEKRRLCKERGIRLITIFDGFSGNPDIFPSDFYYTSGSLNEKNNEGILREIIFRIFDEIGITTRFSAVEWKEITDEAWMLSRKRTTKDFREKLMCISPEITVYGEYKNNKTRIACLCQKCGYQWTPTPDKLLQGRGCPRCAGTMKKTHIQFCEEMRISNPKVTVLGEYQNAKTKVRVHCNICEHIWSASPSTLLKGHGCPKCASKTSGEKVKEVRAKSNNLMEKYPEVLADWDAEKNLGINTAKIAAGSTIKYHWKCSTCGFEYLSSPGNRIRHGCPQCARKRTIAASFRSVINLDTQEVFPSLRAAGEKYGGTSKGVSNACAGRVKTAYGYRWAYYDNEGPRHRAKAHISEKNNSSKTSKKT